MHSLKCPTFWCILLLVSLLGACGDDGDKSVSCPQDCPETACQPDGTCSAERCADDGTCPEGQYCEADSNRCLPGCLLDQLCDGNKVCDPQTRECVSCNPDGGLDCPADSGVCSVDDGTCVECNKDGDCGLGLSVYCQPQSHQCIPGCLSPNNCPSGLTCDATIQLCVGCREDSDCKGLRCMGDDAQRFCAECVADPGCGVGSGEFCDVTAYACIPGCLEDISCPEGQTCNAERRRCE